MNAAAAQCVFIVFVFPVSTQIQMNAWSSERVRRIARTQKAAMNVAVTKTIQCWKRYCLGLETNHRRDIHSVRLKVIFGDEKRKEKLITHGLKRRLPKFLFKFATWMLSFEWVIYNNVPLSVTICLASQVIAPIYWSAMTADSSRWTPTMAP